MFPQQGWAESSIERLIAGRISEPIASCFDRMDPPSGSLQGYSSHRPGLSILVPVYNERQTVLQVLKRVREVPFPLETEIIVVDDGSTDGTTELLRNLPTSINVRVFYHESNQGKGQAVQTALRHVRGGVVVIQDADDELNPHDLLPMFVKILRGESEVCFGSRFAGDVGRFRWYPLYWANRFLNGLSNMINGQNLTDMNTCYKMMRVNVARRLNLVSRGFAMEPEITSKLARQGIRIIEHPISYRPRGKADGKKIRAMDFFRYLVAMVRFRYWNQDSAYIIPEARRAEKAML